MNRYLSACILAVLALPVYGAEDNLLPKKTCGWMPRPTSPNPVTKPSPHSQLTAAQLGAVNTR